MAIPVIQLEAVAKHYEMGQHLIKAVDGIDLAIERNEYVVFIGSSGSGKSTVMNIVGCLDTPSAGSYNFCGLDVANFSNDQLALLRRNYLGFIFQSFNLIARTTALENVELPLVYKGVKPSIRRKIALEALDSVGLAQRFDHTPAQLSGGQQQRVAIARALVTDPTLLLADEPTGNLDTKTTQEVINLLKTLNEERGITVVMVTHEPEVAVNAQRVLWFVDGRLEKDGTPQEVLT